MCKEVCLQNLKTGVTMTWKSQKECAEFIGASRMAVSSVMRAKCGTIKKEWSYPGHPKKPVQKKEDYVPVPDEGLDEMIALAPKINMALEKMNLAKVFQWVRESSDALVCRILGVGEINRNDQGWDGLYDGAVPFENKNVLSDKTLTSVLQDTSDEKLGEMRDGVLLATSYWTGFLRLGFVIINNTRRIAGYVSKHRDSRRLSCKLPLNENISSGGEIVAIGMTRKEVYDFIMSRYPRSGIRLRDIRMKKDIRKIVNKHAYCK